MDFIKTYVDNYARNTESPKMFHLWTALSTIASVVGRKVWFDYGFFKLYPNMYIVFVSPPGMARKSTAIKMGRELLKPIPKLHFSSDAITMQALIMDMAKAQQAHTTPDGQIYTHSSYTAHCSELEILIRPKDREMVKFLTDIYDCGNPDVWENKTKNKGEDIIYGPCFNMLAATTPEDINNIFTVSSIGGGLAARMIIIYAEKAAGSFPFPKIDPEQYTAKAALIAHLNRITKLYGEFKISPHAKALYEGWYHERSHGTGDMRTVGYFERKHIHTMKLAMLAALSEKENNLIIQQHHIEFALTQLDTIEPGIIKAFQGVGSNRQVSLAENILRQLEKGEMTFEDIIAQNFWESTQENTIEVLNTLQQLRKISNKVVDVKGQACRVYFLRR